MQLGIKRMCMKNKVEIQQGSNDIYKNAVLTIKQAILKSQYQAAKLVNRRPARTPSFCLPASRQVMGL